MPTSAVVLDDVSFWWPDGSVVLDRVSAAFSPGRTGLVGANGSGKSTLLRLVAGEIVPTAGTLTTRGVVACLPQDVTRRSETMADLLGVRATVEALRAIERGSTDPRHYEVVGDDWDLEERAVVELDALGLPTRLDRPVATLSGGEAMLAAIVGLRLRRADVVLLDEPTNNLDRDARRRLYEVVDAWRGTLVVASHDLELLDRLDATAELREHRLTVFGGPCSAHRAWVEAQQESARQALRTAEQRLRRERRDRVRLDQKVAHSARQGRKDRENKRYVKAVLDRRRNAAERSAAGRREVADARLEAARADVDAAERALRDDERIHVDLPDPAVPTGRRVLVLPSADGRRHAIQGPERVALVGPNGVGKTTLLETVLPEASARVGHLPQRLVLDEDATVLDLVRSAAPGVPPAVTRDRLARLLVRGAAVERTVGSLSGGERFRVALALLLLADPPPELLVLDEPTNDLDLPSVDRLVEALEGYRGALLVVSHDRRFLARLRLDRVLRLDSGGVLREAGLDG